MCARVGCVCMFLTTKYYKGLGRHSRSDCCIFYFAFLSVDCVGPAYSRGEKKEKHYKIVGKLIQLKLQDFNFIYVYMWNMFRISISL